MSWDTPTQAAERLGQTVEWANLHVGVHRCVDDRIYRVSCLVTDASCDRVARSYIALKAASSGGAE